VLTGIVAVAVCIVTVATGTFVVAAGTVTVDDCLGAVVADTVTVGAILGVIVAGTVAAVTGMVTLLVICGATGWVICVEGNIGDTGMAFAVTKRDDVWCVCGKALDVILDDTWIVAGMTLPDADVIWVDGCVVACDAVAGNVNKCVDVWIVDGDAMSDTDVIRFDACVDWGVMDDDTDEICTDGGGGDDGKADDFMDVIPDEG
jgi:hypothetical protein